MCVAFALGSWWVQLYGQEELLRIESGVENLEFQLSEEKNEADQEAVSEELHQLQMNPVCINSEEISILPGLGLISESQYYKLKEYRYRYGDLLTLNELQTIEGWNTETIRRVLPFVSMNKGGYFIEMPKEKNYSYHHDILLYAGRYLEKSAGYITPDTLPAAYGGDPWRFSFRYDARLGKHLKAGFRVEKDPGECLLPYHPEYAVRLNSFDFFSGYLMVCDLKLIKFLCAGDYRVRFGRGITLSTGSGFSSWKNPFTMSSSGRKFRQNTSMAESGFFRGGCLSLGMNGITVDMFYSRMKVDPSGMHCDSTGEGWFTGFRTDGYHRTASEVLSRGLLEETSYGCMAEYAGRWFRAGAAYIRSELSLSKHPSGSTYASMDFSGTLSETIGAFAEASIRKSFAYCEVSCEPGGKTAAVAGWQAVLAPSVSLSADFRHFPVGFHPGLHASGPGPYGSLSCETGLSLGLNLGLPGKWNALLTVDAARDPWLRYQVDGSGRKYALYANVSRQTNLMDLSFGYTYRQGLENISLKFSYIEPQQSVIKNQLDIQLVICQGERFRFKSRLSWLAVNKPGTIASQGIGMQEEILFRFSEPQLKLTLGAILFNTDAFSSGIYMYEPDVLYASGSRTLYGDGIRSYFILKWKWLKAVELSLKFARTCYSDRVTVGSGPEKVNGNERSEIKLQLHYRL